MAEQSEPEEPTPEQVEEARLRLSKAQARIAAASERSGRSASAVRLVAVSKYRPVAQTLALRACGVEDFGESRVQEARRKAQELPGDIRWHVIGRLQTNKAKYLPEFASWLHSLDRLDQAEALNKAFSKAGRVLSVLIQVNIAGEEQKGGVSPEAAGELIERCRALECLDVRGLMTMAPYSDDPEAARPTFAGLRTLAEEIRQRLGLELPELSMGMSGDYEVAVEEGSTMVRIGTALYE